MQLLVHTYSISSSSVKCRACNFLPPCMHARCGPTFLPGPAERSTLVCSQILVSQLGHDAAAGHLLP